jgi:hypothetical protein
MRRTNASKPNRKSGVRWGERWGTRPVSGRSVETEKETADPSASLGMDKGDSDASMEHRLLGSQVSKARPGAPINTFRQISYRPRGTVPDDDKLPSESADYGPYSAATVSGTRSQP